jgi:hypothetical protein
MSSRHAKTGLTAAGVFNLEATAEHPVGVQHPDFQPDRAIRAASTGKNIRAASPGHRINARQGTGTDPRPGRRPLGSASRVFRGCGIRCSPTGVLGHPSRLARSFGRRAWAQTAADLLRTARLITAWMDGCAACVFVPAGGAPSGRTHGKAAWELPHQTRSPVSTRSPPWVSTRVRFVGGRRGDVLRFTVSGSSSDRVAGSES